MDRHDPQSEVFEAATAETCHFHAFEQVLLGREFANAFNEVLVAAPVLGDQFAHFGDQAVGIGVVNLCQKRFMNLGEFEAVKPPAGL